MTTAAVVTGVIVAAAAVAIVKMLTSPRGRVNIPGVEMSWGK